MTAEAEVRVRINVHFNVIKARKHVEHDEQKHREPESDGNFTNLKLVGGSLK